MKKSNICRYCGGEIQLIPAGQIYGSSVHRLGYAGEYVFQCKNCDARVGCHRGTSRPLGNVVNETLRLKGMEAHRVFDTFWKSQHMIRATAYRWLSQKLRIPERKAQIGGLEMDQCREIIMMCGTGDERQEVSE